MLIQKQLGREIFENLKVDWKNPRVVCIAESYSKFDIDTVEVVPMRIELFKYRYYENNLLSLEPLNVAEQKPSKESQGGSLVGVVDYSVDDLLKKADESIQKVFNELRQRIFELDENITEKATSLYVAYRVSKNFIEMYIGKNQLKLFLRPIEYDDPLGRIEKIPAGYNWTLDKRTYLRKMEDIDYTMRLIETSYQDVL